MTGCVIILEGLDCTGKSTVAKQLYDALSAPAAVVHAGPPGEEATAIREYAWPLSLAENGYTVICDRWHIGELVWPAIFARESLFTIDQLPALESEFKYYRVPLLAVHMVRELNGIRRELKRRGELTYDLEKASELYQEAMAASTLEWLNMTYNRAYFDIYRWVREHPWLMST